MRQRIERRLRKEVRRLEHRSPAIGQPREGRHEAEMAREIERIKADPEASPEDQHWIECYG